MLLGFPCYYSCFRPLSSRDALANYPGYSTTSSRPTHCAYLDIYAYAFVSSLPGTTIAITITIKIVTIHQVRFVFMDCPGNPQGAAPLPLRSCVRVSCRPFLFHTLSLPFPLEHPNRHGYSAASGRQRASLLAPQDRGGFGHAGCACV